MDMKERLLDDLKKAMREKDSLRKDLLQIVRAGILQAEKDDRRTLDEEEILEVLSRELKKRQEVVEELADSNRQDIVDKNRAEMAILENYLPQQLSESEIDQMVLKAIQESGARSARDMGSVMKIVLPQVKGRADGKQVNLAVRRHLGG